MPFFQKSIKGSEQEDVQQHEESASKNWLTMLSTNHRRPSMGFAGDTTGTSFIDDDNSNSFQGNDKVRMVVPKSLFGIGGQNTIDTPSPGDDSVFSIAVNADNHQLTLIHENTDFMDTNTMQPSASNHQLADLVNSGQFTVATQESLEQLKSMRERLDNNKEHDVFEMDDDDDFKKSKQASVKNAAVAPVEKPPGKIMSKIMQSGLAQNWFFKNPDADQDHHDSEGSGSRKTSANSSQTAPVVHVEDANAMWDYSQGQKLQKSTSATGFTGLLADKSASAKKKTEDRVTNFMAPQNF